MKDCPISDYNREGPRSSLVLYPNLCVHSAVNRHRGVDEGVVLADQVYFSDLCR